MNSEDSFERMLEPGSRSWLGEEPLSPLALEAVWEAVLPLASLALVWSYNRREPSRTRRSRSAVLMFALSSTF